MVSEEIATPIGLSLYTISDPSEILESGDVLDAFVNNWSKNPFSLSGFFIRFMKSNRVIGWTPFVLVIKADEKIVGIAPLMKKKRLGQHFVQFFPHDGFSPDFIIDNQYRQVCMRCFLEYLFTTLNCNFVSFNMDPESPNLEIIEQQCKVHGISFSARPQWEHRIIPVECTWDEFQKKKGRRRIIRQIERKLDQIGSWRIEQFENPSNRPDILEKILNVEKLSWKESERKSTGIELDEETLLMIWEGSQTAARNKQDFKWSIWFLQINCEIVAYTFAVKYKEKAFITTTSYDDHYRKFYVGKYITNIAVRDLFNEGQFKTIDFMGDSAFMSFWSSVLLSNVRVFMCKTNLAPLVKYLRSNSSLSRVSKDVLSTTRLFKELSALFDLMGDSESCPCLNTVIEKLPSAVEQAKKFALEN
jgi:hypothetical protein